MKQVRVQKISPELERALLAGVIWGAVPPESLDTRELSVPGSQIVSTVRDMMGTGSTPPLNLQAILLVLTETYGMNRASAQALLEGVQASLPSSEGAEAAVRKLREKHILLTLANTAMNQLKKGEFNVEELSGAVTGFGTTKPPTPLAEEIRGGLPDPPLRLPMRMLRTFSERIGGGLIGLTVLAGEPAVGKSRLAWQIALDVNSSGTPVVYYDLDNGTATLLDRTRKIFDDNHAEILAATRMLYLRDSIRTIDSDLVHIPPPCLVVVDILQALPVSQEFERQGLANWMHRFAGLRRRGYHVLLVSEVNRSFYGSTGLGAFKGSGEIEYVADLGLQMVPAGQRSATVSIVKNRHSELKGEVITLSTGRGTLWVESSGELWGPTDGRSAQVQDHQPNPVEPQETNYRSRGLNF